MIGADNWKLRKRDHKYLECFEMMEKIIWTDGAKNAVLQKVL
jgi:hypothetical protein